MAELHSLEPAELDRFVQRSKASSTLTEEPDLPPLFRQILQKAAELVPSESGAILLDDPLTKRADRSRNELHFVSVFGPASEDLMGESIFAMDGVAGYVYRTGRPHLSARTEEDDTFDPRLDASTGYQTHSIIAAPILIGGAVCGTIELLNRRDGGVYTEQDLVLLQVFASYTASSIQNALDARYARELAKIDDLTGLFNDRYLYVRLREELQRRGCALVFFDLDHFKPVNDTYGHLVGSQVLREIGYLLRRITADQDAVLARYGGDEFTVLLPDRTAEEAAAVAERIRKAIANATFLERPRGPDLPALRLRNKVTASLGVAATNGKAAAQEGQDPVQTLLRRADHAMYEAKAAGKNRVRVARADEDATPPLAGKGRVS
ncbi:MAG: sensor domain-containing diguanylate cyclase [Longimicrobiales bacterium]|nr:sensor domain-containing diguanylate cyclase [Longimicrobiales bacterium]